MTPGYNTETPAVRIFPNRRERREVLEDVIYVDEETRVIECCPKGFWSDGTSRPGWVPAAIVLGVVYLGINNWIALAAALYLVLTYSREGSWSVDALPHDSTYALQVYWKIEGRKIYGPFPADRRVVDDIFRRAQLNKRDVDPASKHDAWLNWLFVTLFGWIPWNKAARDRGEGWRQDFIQQADHAVRSYWHESEKESAGDTVGAMQECPVHG